MINFVYLINKVLEKIAIIDNFTSIIWNKKFNDFGEFELCLPATTENFDNIKNTTFIMRPDDDMIGMIKKVELDTNVESGDQIIVSGYGAEILLSQRIVWNTINFDGTVENLIRKMINDAFINPPANQYQRIMRLPNGYEYAPKMIDLQNPAADFSETTIIQISYDNIGEKIKELCKTYNYGFKMTFPDYTNKKLVFELYKSNDLSDTVIFSEKFNNLIETKFTVDKTDMANAVLIGGDGEGSERKRAEIYSLDFGFYRYEIFADAKSVSSLTTLGELKELYPSGDCYYETSEGYYVYKMSEVLVLIQSNAELAQLQGFFAGEIITVGGIDYFKIENVIVAEFYDSTDWATWPSDNDSATYDPYFYLLLLFAEGESALENKGKKTSFESTIISNLNYEYKKDWDVGDIVAIKNKYGVAINARITEVLENQDTSGYHIEPHFEYIDEAEYVTEG